MLAVGNALLYLTILKSFLFFLRFQISFPLQVYITWLIRLPLLSTSPYSAREELPDNNKLGKSKKFIIIRSPPKTLSNSQSTMTIATPCDSAGNTAGNKSAPLFKNKIIPTINYSDESTRDGTSNNNNNDISTVIVQHPLETFVKAR